jgi:hypothetical protein
MTDKERDGAKLLLMMNAVQYLVLNIPPHNDRLEIDPTLIPDLRQTMSIGMLSKDPSVICAFALAGYYTGALEPKGLGAQTWSDNPRLFAELESKFLGNSCIRNFLSVVADAYREDGDMSIYNRLVAKDAYVSDGPGKDFARGGVPNTPRKRGFWSSLFG